MIPSPLALSVRLSLYLLPPSSRVCVRSVVLGCCARTPRTCAACDHTLPCVGWDRPTTHRNATEALRVVNNDRGGKVVTTIFEAEGTLGSSASAHMEETGALVLDLTMITGFDRTETRLVLWTAPGSDSIGRGSYARQEKRPFFMACLGNRHPAYFCCCWFYDHISHELIAKISPW